MINESDKQFIRRVLMPYFKVRRVAIDRSESKAKFPDIWCQPVGHTPVITITPEWERQSTPERRSRLVHEFLHIDGLDHDPDIGYVSHPEQDVYSKALYRYVTKVMTRNPQHARKAYFCSICNRTHILSSKMGQKHYQSMIDFLSTPREKEKLSPEEVNRKLYESIFDKAVENPGATALTREGYSPGYFVQTPEQRKAKYRLARELGANQSWASAIRDWRSAKIFRWAGLPIPSQAR